MFQPLWSNVPGYGAINIMGIYRPPNKPIQDFLLKLDCILDSCRGMNPVLAGDFNLDLC